MALFSYVLFCFFRGLCDLKLYKSSTEPYKTRTTQHSCRPESCSMKADGYGQPHFDRNHSQLGFLGLNVGNVFIFAINMYSQIKM